MGCQLEFFHLLANGICRLTNICISTFDHLSIMLKATLCFYMCVLHTSALRVSELNPQSQSSASSPAHTPSSPLHPIRSNEVELQQSLGAEAMTDPCACNTKNNPTSGYRNVPQTGCGIVRAKRAHQQNNPKNQPHPFVQQTIWATGTFGAT